MTSFAELEAEKAENLKSFSGLKLLHVKKQVSAILAQIGRDGIFDEYTKHDISHIDGMLELLNGIIPDSTKKILTPGDWMMITLAIYFHDLGMLVTKDEFKERNATTFPLFKQSIVEGKFGLDYRDKILNIGDPEKRDRFIYQELVRSTHAERIRYWILNEHNPSFPNKLQIVDEIKKLIVNVDPLFKRDLANVCESHHLSDLDDFTKYKPFQQYGPSVKEVVNVQYAALLLRTADLLHITSDRTPSIEFNLINPSDPISQEEWAKQSAVKAIRPQTKKNKEGELDATIPKDTFEVIALFEEENGFFGLIAYLNYASKQLKENFKLNEISKKINGTKYEYPWRNIDDSNIETKDFDKRQFEFVIDQTRILDLLIGHTLYNDSTVVLRELTQNAIDASKLKTHELKLIGENDYTPEIIINWNESSRELSFIDNGTGMTLDIIQNHLLKVGSSRYQDEAFKKQYPDFSPISRFGIGLLTCFLIADDIDITTKSSDQDKGILLKIKKVHGKYLLKYLSPDRLDPHIKEHGTIIKLFIRADAELENIEYELKKWILVPNCKVTLINNGESVRIGGTKISEILKEHLENSGFTVDGTSVKIEEIDRKGVTFTYALRYIENWNEWDFLEYNDTAQLSPIGTCIEGIRVDFNTPGFLTKKLYAIVNTSGKNAPKTNVARSNIELTPEREQLLFTIYSLYLEHIANELARLRNEGFSITWAASEANYLLNSVVGRSFKREYMNEIDDVNAFEKALSKLKCILIEIKEKRDVISIDELKQAGHFWTIDCASYDSADSLLKEIKSSNTSALSLLKNIFDVESSNTQHIDNLLCNRNSNDAIDSTISATFQVNSIKIIPEQRRLDLRWAFTEEKIWEQIILEEDRSYYSNSVSKCYIQIKEIELDRSINQTIINSSNALLILSNSELNKFLVKMIKAMPAKSQEDNFITSKVIRFIYQLFFYKKIDRLKIEEAIEQRIERNINSTRDDAKIIWNRIDKEELISAILKTKFVKYDTTIWYRRKTF